jgi:hypothetical protein
MCEKEEEGNASTWDFKSFFADVDTRLNYHLFQINPKCLPPAELEK